MSSNYLIHHGILGQKWGKKNGPPYPLDFSKLSSEEKEKAKRSTIEKADIVTASKNKTHFSDSELNEIINRYQLHERVSALSQEKINRGKDRYKQISKNLATYNDVTNKLEIAANNSAKMYNVVAKIANAFGDKDLPIIGQQKKSSSGRKVVNIDNVNNTKITTITDANGNTRIVKEKIK